MQRSFEQLPCAKTLTADDVMWYAKAMCLKVTEIG